MGSAVEHAGREVVADLVLHGGGVDIRRRRFQVWIDAADGERGACNASFRVETRCHRTQRRTRQAREGESEGRRIAGPLHEHRRARRPGKKGRQDQARRIASEFFLHVRLRQPVGVHAKPAAHHPVALARDIPGDAGSRVERFWRLIERVLRRPVPRRSPRALQRSAPRRDRNCRTPSCRFASTGFP